MDVPAPGLTRNAKAFVAQSEDITFLTVVVQSDKPMNRRTRQDAMNGLIDSLPENLHAATFNQKVTDDEDEAGRRVWGTIKGGGAFRTVAWCSAEVIACAAVAGDKTVVHGQTSSHFLSSFGLIYKQ